jgi:Ca-activated chloride channel homolog
MRTRIGLFSGLIAIITLCLTARLNGQNQQSEKPMLFKKDPETVSIWVSVTNAQAQPVHGLKQEFFSVYEDGARQSVKLFDRHSTQISLGIVFDVSNSMRGNNKLQKAQEAIKRFLETDLGQDEYFMVVFNKTIQVISSNTGPNSMQQNREDDLKSRRRSAVFDAIYAGLDQIKERKHDKKALIVISDGEDNCSQHSVSEIFKFARNSDVLIYSIIEQGRLGYGQYVIDNLTDLTGGKVYYTDSFTNLDHSMKLIQYELHNQYMLCYTPTNRKQDGKWRKLNIQLKAPKSFPKLTIRAREGYYAPSN